MADEAPRLPADPVAASVDRRSGVDPRPVGAAIGAVLAGVVLAAVVWFLGTSDGSGPVGLAVALGSGSPFGNRPSIAPAIVVTGTVAAGIAGWLLARPAADSIEWAGLWMGAITYTTAIVLAPVAYAVTSVTSSDGLDLTQTLGAAPIIWMVGSVLFAPLLVACFVAGPAWASMLRVAIGREVPPPARVPTFLPVWPLVAGSIALALGWIILRSIASSFNTPVGD